ncbi:MAG: hypothetical protein HZB26_17095 [Candidatus Hydrogenedentes bacterium]|nr:hypothetical protein [Candidatus Hydrogenedentota bacterium]
MSESLQSAREILPLAKDFVLMAAAVVASCVGIMGLGSWRRQLKGNAEYLLAKNLLTAVYELREAISNARHPYLELAGEADLPKEKLSELSWREKHWFALGEAYQKRWAPVAAAKAKIDANLLEAEVVWGQQIRSKATPLDELIGELYYATKDHLEAKNPNLRVNNEELRAAQTRRKIMYSRSDPEKDEYRKRLGDVIADIEDELKPHIVQHHR